LNIMIKLNLIVRILIASAAVVLFFINAFAVNFPKVAVFDFEADNVSKQTALLASSKMRTELANQGRMTILERNEMDKILTEQGKNLAECTQEGCAVQLGQLLDAEKIIIGRVSRTGKRIIVMAKFIDLESGKIDFAKDITLDDIGEDKLTDYISTLADKLSAELVLIGAVIEVGNELLLDIGESAGVRIGDRFTVKREGREIKNPQTGEVLAKERTDIGQIEVTRLIGDKVCACKILNGAGYKTGDFIEQKWEIKGETPTANQTKTSVPPAPLTTAKTYGSVNIITNPTGASLYLDGSEYGSTPVRRDDIVTGDYTMVLHRDGYVDIVQGLTVQSGRTAEVNVNLVKQMGSIKVTTDPVGASVYLDGNYKGTTTSAGLKFDYLSVGSYKVKAEFDKYYSDEKSVEVYYNQTASVNLTLKPKPGSVFVVSTPGGADVYLDDKKQTGKTPFKVAEVSTGAHKVKAYLDGYKTEEKSVMVEAEKTATISFDLVKVEIPTAPPSAGSGSFSGETISGALPGMTFVKIPSGSFQMGSNEDDSEKPIHPVNIKSFYMMTTEVTQAMWKEIMGDNPSNWKGDNLPVECVSWNDVQEFLKKLNQRDPGRNYRLPSEAEWEYACRAGTTTRYYNGDNANTLGEIAWYSNNSDTKTHPVGQKRANAWGLYDMSGNVWEWCEDYWHDNYIGAPTNGSAWLSPSGSYRVLRGGSWYSPYHHYTHHLNNCRSAYRSYDSPSNRYYLSGFRLVRSP
jgi:formylglycine-generating enzyme required for sulfatase activity/TolB-like protein